MSGGGSFPDSISIGDYTVSTLPSATNYAKKLAWVSDLHDGLPDYVMSDGTRWKLVNTDAAFTTTNSNVDRTIYPFVNAPVQIAKGTLSAGRTWTISTTNAYQGMQFTVKREAGGLFSLLVNSIGIGLNSWADFVFDGTNWVQTRSGGLL